MKADARRLYDAITAHAILGIVCLVIVFATSIWWAWELTR